MINKERKRLTYITSPCYYINGKPHPGHLYTNILTNYIAWRMDLPVLNGLDCHGRKVRLTAEGKNLQTIDILVDNGIPFKQIFLRNIRSNKYIFNQTHRREHIEFVTRTWITLCNKGYIYKDYYEGYYSTKDETFLKSYQPDCIRIKEINYFLNTRKLWRKVLLSYCRKKVRVYPSFYLAKIFEFIKEIDNFCISRNESWGIRIPNTNNRTIHVWFDALLYYLSSINYDWKKKIHLIQIIGKDILSFHSWHWIMLLEALDIDYRITLVVHGWLLSQGDKISKSLIFKQKISSNLGSDDVSHLFLNSRTIGLDIKDLSKKEIENFFWNSFVNLINRSLKILLIHDLYSVPRFSFKRVTLIDEIQSIKAYNRFISNNRLWIVNASNKYKIYRFLMPYIIYLLLSLRETNHLRNLVIPWNGSYLLNKEALKRIDTTFSKR